MVTTSAADTDQWMRPAVMRELDWDPRVDDAEVGVTAKEGAVTLSRTSWAHKSMSVAAGVAGFAAGTYAACVALSWWRYGRVTPAAGDRTDALLDQFMPTYDVIERHHIRVAAPAAVTLAAAREQDLEQIFLIRTIFRAREIILRARPDSRPHPRGLLALTRQLGWGILAEAPDREIVVGAVTKPWEANVTFHALPPEEFPTFAQPGYVKIAWTLRADPVGTDTSIFRTETRAVATDATARARFRRYWAFTSAGIALIRRLSLQPLRRSAERRARAAARLAGRVG